jgi:hypothetical protein
MKRNIVILILFFILCSIYSQTIEDKLLKKKEQKIVNYYYQAKARGREGKLVVLDSILKDIKDKNYTKDDVKLVELVSFLAQEGSVRQDYENNRLINDYPDVRRNACILLGEIGGQQAREALLEVLHQDQSYMVKAEACNSLAKLKEDPTGQVLRTVVFVYRSTYKPEPNFVIAIINAIKTISKGNEQVYGDAITILSEIQMGQFTRTVREEAYKAIKFLNEED